MSVKKYLDKLEDLKGKKVIVTGGTSGIGLSIVKELLYKNVDVVIMARNLKKADEVKGKLLEDYPDKQITIVKYDQSDEKSVIEASDIIAKEHSDFYALILNAGVFATKSTKDKSSDESLTVKTNFIGLNLFLENLLPKLKGEHRLIFQGSLVAGWRNKKTETLKVNHFSSFQQYIISKSGVECLFYHYSKSDSEFSFYLVEPGITGTDIIRDFPTPIKQLGRGFLKLFSHSNEKAALTAMLALQSTTSKNAFIVPRGLGTMMGYPKFKKFPKKRQREYLYELLNKQA